MPASRPASHRRPPPRAGIPLLASAQLRASPRLGLDLPSRPIGPPQPIRPSRTIRPSRPIGPPRPIRPSRSIRPSHPIWRTRRASAGSSPPVPAGRRRAAAARRAPPATPPPPAPPPRTPPTRTPPPRTPPPPTAPAPTVVRPIPVARLGPGRRCAPSPPMPTSTTMPAVTAWGRTGSSTTRIALPPRRRPECRSSTTWLRRGGTHAPASAGASHLPARNAPRAVWTPGQFLRSLRPGRDRSVPCRDSRAITRWSLPSRSWPWRWLSPAAWRRA